MKPPGARVGDHVVAAHFPLAYSARPASCASEMPGRVNQGGEIGSEAAGARGREGEAGRNARVSGVEAGSGRHAEVERQAEVLLNDFVLRGVEIEIHL
ncbi:unnamed protein product [Miscanthus lutarioriparius]|uniref:Uncharacterized protein n=1 Tax=Miscanthus lutarioriparius TaxID=422564 RepID=A0A811SBY3_9POAL|nr:unnamed protein product [Miscanthus lutarioriparius]